jgi:hypothetical protein
MPKSRSRRKKAKPQTTTTKIKLHPRAIAALERQLEAFRKKFGREPGPNDPVFFDPDTDVPVPMSMEKMEAQALEALLDAGAPPEFTYAYKKTGMLSVSGDVSMWAKDRREEWEAAVAEYRLMEEAAQSKPEKH